MAPASPPANTVAAEELKIAMRARAREARLARSDRLRTAAANALAAHTLALPEIASATCVSVYASRSPEPGTLPLMVALADRGVRVLVPSSATACSAGGASSSAPTT